MVKVNYIVYLQLMLQSWPEDLMHYHQGQAVFLFNCFDSMAARQCQCRTAQFLTWVDGVIDLLSFHPPRVEHSDTSSSRRVVNKFGGHMDSAR